MSIFRTVFAGLSMAVATGAAVAAATPVSYTFTTVARLAAPPGHAVASLLGNDQVSGSFRYNSGGAFLGNSGDSGFDPGLSAYGGATADTVSFYQLKGQVGGRNFSDVVGSVSVGNDNVAFGGIDFLTFIADVPPRVGQNTTPTDIARQLVGFTVGDFTLHNARMLWTAPGATGFLSSNDLPSAPPTFTGVLALDFIRTSDPTNTANVPYYSNTVFYALQVQAAPVPEPASVVLAMAGLLAVGVLARRRTGAAGQPQRA